MTSNLESLGLITLPYAKNAEKECVAVSGTPSTRAVVNKLLSLHDAVDLVDFFMNERARFWHSTASEGEGS